MAAVYYSLTNTPSEVLTLAEAKMQLKVEDLSGYDDTLVQDCIDAAIDEAEQYCNINILERKFKVELDDWYQNFEFKQQYVTAIDKITYKPLDESGDVVLSTTEAIAAFATLKPADKYANQLYILDFDNAPDLEDTPNAVTIEFSVGYPGGSIPASLKQGIKLMITNNYDYRNDNEVRYTRASRIKLEPYKYYTHE